MLKNLEFTFFISLALHIALIAFFSLSYNKTISINVPFELVYYTQNIKQTIPVVVKDDKDSINLKKQKNKKVIKKIEEKAEKQSPDLPKNQTQTSTQKQSSQIALDNARFPYNYYTNAIVKRINANWQWSINSGRYKAVVYFKIEKNGHIAEVHIKNSSGDKTFDQQALRAVLLADPFAPLPEGFNENYLGVFFEFSFIE